MALSVKAYIFPDTSQQEIRRFAIDEGASANYAYLVQKIEQVFPIVRGKIFKLFWKGEEIEFVLGLHGSIVRFLYNARSMITLFVNYCSFGVM